MQTHPPLLSCSFPILNNYAAADRRPVHLGVLLVQLLCSLPNQVIRRGLVDATVERYCDQSFGRELYGPVPVPNFAPDSRPAGPYVSSKQPPHRTRKLAPHQPAIRPSFNFCNCPRTEPS